MDISLLSLELQYQITKQLNLFIVSHLDSSRSHNLESCYESLDVAHIAPQPHSDVAIRGIEYSPDAALPWPSKTPIPDDGTDNSYTGKDMHYAGQTPRLEGYSCVQ